MDNAAPPHKRASAPAKQLRWSEHVEEKRDSLLSTGTFTSEDLDHDHDDDDGSSSSGGSMAYEDEDEDYWHDKEIVTDPDQSIGVRLFYAVKYPEFKSTWLNILFGDRSGDPRRPSVWKMVERTAQRSTGTGISASPSPQGPHRGLLDAIAQAEEVAKKPGVLVKLQDMCAPLCQDILEYCDRLTAARLSGTSRRWRDLVAEAIRNGSVPQLSYLRYTVSGLASYQMAATEHHGWSPMHVAAYMGNVDALHAIIQSGYATWCLKKPKAHTDDSPLHAAVMGASGASARIVNILCHYASEQDMDELLGTELRNGEGLTALHVACVERDTHGARALLACDADIEAKCDYAALRDVTALGLVVEDDYTELPLLACLLQMGADVNCALQSMESSVVSTPLLRAVERKEVEVAKLLLEAKADPNTAGGLVVVGVSNPMTLTDDATSSNLDYGCPAVAHSVEDAALLQVLVDAGADVNKQSPLGFTALHVCVARSLDGWLSARMLSSWQWDAETSKTGDMEKDLMMEFEASQEAVVRVLLDARADVTLADNQQRTAGHLYREVCDVETRKPLPAVLQLLQQK